MTDFSSPENSLFGEDADMDSSEAATTVIEEEEAEDELMEVNPEDFPDTYHSPEILE